MSPEAMAELHARCFVRPPPWPARAFAQQLAERFAVVVHSDAGFALGRVIGDEAELLTLAVAPERRRAGAGRALLARFEEQAALRGGAHVYLEVAADNLAARALYAAAGYVQTGVRPGYYAAPGQDRVDALILNKRIGPVHA